jgi:hypothetical protein
MSWLFSRALVEACESLRSSLERVEAFSAASCSDGEPSAQLNVMPTQHPFWLKDKTMEASRFSRFGLTCRVLTEDRGAALLTWYLEDFPAKTSRQPARVEASKASALDSGDKWPESWVKYDRATSSWKTAQRSLLGGLESFLGTWPNSGLMRAGMCWELPTSAPVIGESEFGYAPTVLTSEATGPGLHGNGSHNFRTWFRANSTEKRSPLHGELMMLWPEGWATVGAPLATAKFRQWLQRHGASSEAA